MTTSEKFENEFWRIGLCLSVVSLILILLMGTTSNIGQLLVEICLKAAMGLMGGAIAIGILSRINKLFF